MSRRLSEIPDALASWDVLACILRLGRPAVLLDFDGTLSKIVTDPRVAWPVGGARAVLERLTRGCPTAVLSGRDLPDVRRRVGVDAIWYGGSHGFELAGPRGQHHEHPAGCAAETALAHAAATVTDRLARLSGLLVEPKHFAVAVHYRNVAADHVEEVLNVVRELADSNEGLRASAGRKVIELRPDVDWNKGQALRWLLPHMVDAARAVPVYAGDDFTDEDALEAVAANGIGIVVRHSEHGDRLSAARVAVDGPEELCQWLTQLAALLGNIREAGA